MALQEKQRGLILVSNRLPLSVKGMSDSIQCTKSSGGLVAALSGLTNSMKCRWLGWPGISPQGPEEEGKVSESLAAHDARAIFLDPQLAHDHYNRFSSIQCLPIAQSRFSLTYPTDSILWPILHYQSGVSFDENAWNAYQRVNSLFAEAVADEANDNDLIWVHDYHLLLVPSMLRNRLQEQGKHCAVGFTLHTPFPAGDFWRALPVHKELLEGVLASDVVGFHTDEYKHNFIQGCAHGLYGPRYPIRHKTITKASTETPPVRAESALTTKARKRWRARLSWG